MKKILYKITGIGVVCFAFALTGIAQEIEPVPPPPPPEAPAPSGDHPSEIIIRQKGDKDGKVTIEIRNGDFFLNGKPLDKFEDQNIEVEKRMAGDEPVIRISTSPFRGNAMEMERLHREVEGRVHESNRRLMEIDGHRTNEAFLGVSSRKAETGGATVLDVSKGSPAEKAGLKKGDIISKVNEQNIDSPDNLFETIHQFKPGDKIKITFKRDGKEQSVSAVLDKSKSIQRSFNLEYALPETSPYPEADIPGLPGLESPIWGPMPPKMGFKAQDSEDDNGAVVLDITEGSAAEKAGLKKGDRITSFDGTPVTNADELIKTVRRANNKSLVKVKIQRDSKALDLDIRIPRKLKTAEL